MYPISRDKNEQEDRFFLYTHRRERDVKAPTIAINTFVHRQTAESAFSHFDGPNSVLVELAQSQFPQSKPGFRDGVVRVPVPAAGFYSGIVPITKDNVSQVISVFERRQEGEEFYLAHRLRGVGKSPAVSVELILYNHAVFLDEDGDTTSDAEWEIVSINASPTKEPTPQDPLSMARNQLHKVGGTEGALSPVAMAEAIDFHSRHAMVEDGYRHIRVKKENYEEVVARLGKAGISCVSVNKDAGYYLDTVTEMVYMGVACTRARFNRFIACLP